MTTTKTTTTRTTMMVVTVMITTVVVVTMTTCWSLGWHPNAKTSARRLAESLVVIYLCSRPHRGNSLYNQSGSHGKRNALILDLGQGHPNDLLNEDDDELVDGDQRSPHHARALATLHGKFFQRKLHGDSLRWSKTSIPQI